MTPVLCSLILGWVLVVAASGCQAQAAASAAGATAPGSAAAATAAVPLEDFFRPAWFSSPALSTSGRYLAGLARMAERRVGMVVVDLAGPAAPTFIEASPNTDVVWVRWVSDDWLIFSVGDVKGRQPGRVGGGLIAVKRDGSEPHMLIRRSGGDGGGWPGRERALGVNHVLLDLGPPGSLDLVVGEAKFDVRGSFSHFDLKRLNVVSGEWRRVLDEAPRRTDLLQDTRGRVRLLVDVRDNEVVLYAPSSPSSPSAPSAPSTRAAADGDKLSWREISRKAQLDQDITPLYVESDRSIVVARDGAEQGELLRLDLQTGRIEGEPLLTTPGFSMQAQPIFGADGHVAGLRVDTDAASTHWFDADMRALQARVDARLPGRINLLDCWPCDKPAAVVVTSWSDVQPPQYLLFRPGSDEWRLLGEQQPQIDARRMAGMEFHRTRARDGRDLPLWLTRPASAVGQAAPTVVLVHGGPFLRGAEWGWRREAQFLASRGYVVIEPEFRGSLGYGDAHFRAGWKQYGLAMQDDVADALQHAIAQGWTDPRRVCIVGASYGGYAALQGLARDPGLYRCGVAMAALTDPRHLYDMHWSDLDFDYRRYGLPVMVGERRADEARLIAGSPLANVDKIVAPVLLVHGGKDRRVPVENGERMRDALKKLGKPVEWVLYPEEGHGFANIDNRYDYWRRVVAFLARHLL